jgi:hypothetical protein
MNRVSKIALALCHVSMSRKAILPTLRRRTRRTAFATPNSYA